MQKFVLGLAVYAATANALQIQAWQQLA
jgi:hypothetical protein